MDASSLCVWYMFVKMLKATWWLINIYILNSRAHELDTNDGTVKHNRLEILNTLVEKHTKESTNPDGI